MLTTNLRSTQTLDPAAVTRATGSPTSRPHPACAARPSVVSAVNAIAGAWSITGLAPMPKVGFHPDRWPLHSTS